MTCCIVNGDDFGASAGISRGILEAHVHGILTSTSMMVDMPDAERAAADASRTPSLDIGLHVQLTNEDGSPATDFEDAGRVRSIINRQLRKFHSLLGRMPTHVDSHHNVHFRAELTPVFLDVAQAWKLPLRGHSGARYVPDFYGQWDGETHLEQISPALVAELVSGWAADETVELGCHPGYVDPDFETAYAIEREEELRTLTSTEVRSIFTKHDVGLIGFRHLASAPRAVGGVSSRFAASMEGHTP